MADANFASLSPSLLARKGGAKPAMRPQHALMAAMPLARQSDPSDSDTFEDLGWNDMGDDPPHSGEPIYLTPAPHNADADAEAEANDRAAERELAGSRRPAVVEQQAHIARTIRNANRAAIMGKAHGKRAAFTLRLDAERHLKLKLASAISNRSAQQLVTEALDALISKMPELDSLAAQVKRR